jgi:hypothetical protein
VREDFWWRCCEEGRTHVSFVEEGRTEVQDEL